MRVLILLLINAFTAITFGQTLHHQMLSSQGGNNTSSNGLIVKHTVGQQSVVGTSSGTLIIQQGFQQSNWSKIISSNNSVAITTTTYPNPFRDIVKFKFSGSVGDNVSITIYDVLGRQVFTDSIAITENSTSVNLSQLPSAEYFVKLSNNKYLYHTKIIKND
ncbi:MAG: T9SS type A sorting domain-containing protein [Flavobacterium sp.]